MPDPILDNAQLLRPGAAGPQVSGAAAAAPALAAANLGGAIKGIGQQGFDVAQKIQRAKNAGKLADMRRKMREAAAQFERDTMTQTDESQWLDEWQTAADGLEGEFSSEELAPEVRREFEVMFADFRSKQAQDIQSKALVQSLDRAKSMHMRAADEALFAGDFPAYEAEIRSIPGLPSYEADELVNRGRKRFIHDQIQAQGYEDPRETLNQLDRGDYDNDLPEGDRAQLRHNATVNLNRHKADEAQMIFDAYKNGDIATEGEIETQLAASEFLEEEDMENVRRNIRNTQALTPDEYVPLQDEIEMLGEQAGSMSAEAYRERHAELQTKLTLLGNRVGAERLRRKLGGISEDNLQHLQNLHTENHQDALVRKSGRVVRDIVAKRFDADQLNEVRGDVEDAMEVWIRNHPNAAALTQEDVKAETERQWQERIETGAIESILPDDINPLNPLLPRKGEGPPQNGPQ